ncbi:MED14-domain-containing protein [Coprinopsis marcescibilis]|uniref:Mediator of RNA polymerase II transcription subunit 14 n=1 Tax=Coprinopsis marcescibilis TaxID=230819 RepID=A0A5C3KYQ8_COPMA|nr:MED14-domain-containing protein [Coprinopsis marcescibilis]
MSAPTETSDAMVIDILNDSVVKHNGFTDVQPPRTPIEELERELAYNEVEQIFLGDLVVRVMQAIYTELTEMAETLPSMSDAVRKRTIADWVVKTKKQVVKVYAVVKWSRDADTIQKCKNISGFLGLHSKQFENATIDLLGGKENLGPARTRNYDLLTSLDVLTSGSYLRLPTCIKKRFEPIVPLSDEQVAKTLADMENVILYRLRVSEIIPVEMTRYTIGDGRAHFTVPKLFNVSLCLHGPSPTASWFLITVEFPVTVKGDLSDLQEFPRVPTGYIKEYIANEAYSRMSRYVQEVDIERPKLPEGVVDTPLIRLYNFLQMMSLSYQLEILWFQAQRMRSLGWAEHLSVLMFPDRKTLKASYWLRPPPALSQQRQRIKEPPFGGSITISIEEVKSQSSRTPREHALARLQQQSKLGHLKPSDEIEKLQLKVSWEHSQGVLGVNVPSSDIQLPPEAFEIDPENLDFEALLIRSIHKHTAAILKALEQKLQHDQNGEFSIPGIVSSDNDRLHIRLCADEIVTINIDPRTGRLNLRDTNGLVVANRAPRFNIVAAHLNKAPELLVDRLSELRLNTILALAEQKAQYLGLQYYRTRNFSPQDLEKLGTARGKLFIKLARFPNHYLVLVVKTQGFSFALITTRVIPGDPVTPLVMEDIAFLNFDRIRSEQLANPEAGSTSDTPFQLGAHDHTMEWFVQDTGASSGFDLTGQILKELYNYCCARVAYMNVERQFKLRAIPFTHVNPTIDTPISPEIARIQSSLARSVPALCVQATDILSGAPAAEAAMPNIRVIPINWWSDENAQVVTCVKLKYVQQPLGKSAGTSSVIRPSQRIIYDTKEAVVSFLSENVNTCVDEFLEEWARVSKMVVIAREIAQMSKMKGLKDVQLLSFDLQTVEFAYAPGYSVSITCEDQLSRTGGKFDLRFSRHGNSPSNDVFNPHDDAEPFLSNILRYSQGRLAPALERLVIILRDTLPIAVELEDIRQECNREGYMVDTFAKAAGWYRILYPDLDHALDCRLLSEHRVAIVDASQSLVKPPRDAEPDPTTKPSNDTSAKMDTDAPETSVGSNNTSVSTPNSLAPVRLGLQPIPGFSDIVKSAVKDAVAERRRIIGLADITSGVVCPTSSVGLLIRKIHNGVVAKLKDTA